ncbi:MAG: hypothetical protein ACRENA_12785 [Vulcanimicrobiaceae bacterium]
MGIFQFAQADNYGIAAALITFVLLVAVVVARKWIVQRDEHNAASVGGTLLALSLVAVAAVILAALAGPHPS